MCRDFHFFKFCTILIFVSNSICFHKCVIIPEDKIWRCDVESKQLLFENKNISKFERFQCVKQKVSLLIIDYMVIVVVYSFLAFIACRFNRHITNSREYKRNKIPFFGSGFYGQSDGPPIVRTDWPIVFICDFIKIWGFYYVQIIAHELCVEYST